MPADLGLLIVRVVIGALLMGHGLQKLAGWFGGHGPAGTGQWLESLGLRPGRFWSYVAGLAETLGGALFALGLYNPVGTVLICAVMFMAIARVHWSKGVWVAQGGVEHPLTNAVATVAVALIGPGAYSVDAYAGIVLPVVPVLVAGLAGAILVVALTWAMGVRPAPERRPTA